LGNDSFIITVVILIGFLIFFYVKNRIKKVNQKNEIQKRLLETKMEALQSQMNPHFTFNAMNSIQNYIVRNKMDDALEYLADFSRLIRQTLDNSIKTTIKLEEEIHYLQAYVNLENKRYKTPVAFTITISENIDTTKVEIPPMLMQPFIENCFVHAFTPKIVQPYLKLTITLATNFLLITIQDNGVGFDTKLQKTSSIGINLVKERIKLFNVKDSNFIEIASTINQGTKVTFQINIIS
jgi:sensor histidine kinase YesM